MIPENVKVYSTLILDCWLGDDGIVHVMSKPAERTIENYKEVFEAYNELSSGGRNKFCLLGDISETKPITKEARDFISIEMSKHVKACAMVSHTALGTATGSVFEMLSQNPFPIAMFSDRDQALIWLRQHL